MLTEEEVNKPKWDYEQECKNCPTEGESVIVKGLLSDKG